MSVLPFRRDVERRMPHWRAARVSVPVIRHRNAYSSRSPSVRRGYSLIEALVVISINSILMSVALTLFGTLLKAERHGRQHFEETRSIMRLADDLRRDAASADQAEADQAGGKLQLRPSDGRTIEFTRDEDRIRRVELAGSAVVRREAYHLAGLSRVKFVVVADRQITAELRLNDGSDEPWRIDARLGSGRRFVLAEDAP